MEIGTGDIIQTLKTEEEEEEEEEENIRKGER